MGLLAFMTLVAYAASPERAMSRAKLWGILLQIALFYGMVNGLRRETSILRMVALLLVVTASVALVSILGTDWAAVRLVQLPCLYDRLPQLTIGIPGSGVPRPTTLFHPREVGATMAMLLPLPLALVLFVHRSQLRSLSILALVVGTPVLVLSQSVQAIFGFFLALLFIAAWRDRRFLLSIPLALSSIGAYALLGDLREVGLALLSTDNAIGIAVVLRLDMWRRAVAMIRDVPYSGVGLNTFPIAQSHFYPGYLLGPHEPFAHNQFLQTAIDLGVPGLAAFVWLFVAFYAVVFRTRWLHLPDDLRAILVGIAAGVLAYLAHGLFDCVTLGAKPMAALFVMLGIAIAICRQGTEGVESSTPSTGFQLAPSFLVALAFGAAAIVVTLLAPGAAYRNLGIVRAHRAILAARATGAANDRALAQAETSLRQALARNPHDVSTLRRLASVQAWRGDYAGALASLNAAVALDGRTPYALYAPFERWRQRLQGEPQADRREALLRIYGNWMRRYPGRAEHYVQVALVWREHLDREDCARRVLHAGIDEGAEPSRLLSHYAARIH
jgi:O-antigen ligase